MKTIGLIGGLTWESSAEYYRLINEMVYERLGGRHSASVIMHSLDFDPVDQLMHEGDWEQISARILEVARSLKSSGSDCVLICCNTLHMVADKVSEAINIELINVIDVIAREIKSKGMAKVGLMGSTFTMRNNFYRDRLFSRYGIETIIPPEEDMDLIMTVIEKELGRGVIKDRSREIFLKVIDQMVERGAEGVILGCTEIPLLVKQSDTDVPVFDSTYLHSKAAVDISLSEENRNSE
jgi:aspartate racemase